MKLHFPYIFITCFFSIGCSAIQETSKRQMETGMYKVSTEKNRRFYTVVEEDKITLYPAVKIKKAWIANTDSASEIHLTSKPLTERSTTFISRSMDLDVLTILFKYRPYTSGFPNQLNTNFNGAAYLGHRSDYYILSYDKNPLNATRRTMSHFAYSAGFFGGIGATNMNPFVTGNRLQSEYDGVVITKGVAGLIGVGSLTFGAAIGLDHLMDKNRRVWIYQGKPWIGFTLGLNVN